MDDRHQVQRTGLRDARKLKPLLECIQLRCPDVPVLNYEDSFTDYNTMDEEEWQQVLRDFRLQRGRRESAADRRSFKNPLAILIDLRHLFAILNLSESQEVNFT